MTMIKKGKMVTFIFTIMMLSLILMPALSQSLNAREVVRELLTDYDIRDNLHQTALIICEFANNATVVNAVKRGVDFNLKYGYDEEVRFNDLLASGTKSPAQSEMNLGTSFKTAFQDVLSNYNNKSVSGYGTLVSLSGLEAFLTANNAQVYWPYSEDWDGVTMPVITFHPMEEIDTNVGYQKVRNRDGSYSIKTVQVNEDYCLTHPVWIITQNETDYDDYTSELQGRLMAGAKTEITELNLVKLGKVKCTKQYDFLWNGGPDLRFIAVGAEPNGSSAVTKYESLISVNLSRKDVRKKRIKTINSLWVSQWHPDETNQQFAIFESDGGNKTIKFTGNVTLVISGVPVTAGITLEFTSRDPWIWILSYNRSSFYAYNQQDGGHGRWDGYQVYSSGGVYWNMVEVTQAIPNQTVTLNPIADTYASNQINNGVPYEDRNFGSSTLWHSMAWTSQSKPFTIRSFMKFNVGSIPQGSYIANATLKLSGAGHNPLTKSNASFLRQVTESWSEYGLTWNNKPVSSSAGQISLPQSTSANQVYYINVTNFVRNWVNGDWANHGFELRLQNEAYYALMRFASREYSDPGKRPVLTIQYKQNQY